MKNQETFDKILKIIDYITNVLKRKKTITHEDKLKLLELHVALNAIENAAADTDAIEGRGMEVLKAIDYCKKLCSSCGCGC